MKKDWLVYDEDEEKVVANIYGTPEQALEQFEALKEERDPRYGNYWNTWALYRRES